VRELQRKLWAAAKQSSERRFHALYDRVHRGDVLWEAWRRVLTNRGAAGVDRLTLVQVEEYGVERMLAELQADLRAGSYRPAPVRRVEIPKPDGGRRPLGIPTVRDRVAQQAAKLVLEPIFEADFAPVSYGFRPKRSATQAMERVRTGFIEGHTFVVEFDIRNFFNEIDHARLMELVGLRGWGNYFRTGNAAHKFRQVDRYVVGKLRTLLVKKRGRNLRPGQARQWDEDWFNGLGLHRLRGTIRYPKTA
jgi:RNA-directed DNA polymerase